MVEQTYTVRPGECLLVSEKKQVVTSRHDLDAHGRMNPIGLAADTATIVGAAEGAAISKQYTNVRIVKGERGVLPPRFKPEDQAGQDAFLGRVRTQGHDGLVNELLNAKGLGPRSLAEAAAQLIEAGVMDRDEAIAWAREEYKVAVLSGRGSHEPWRRKVAELLNREAPADEGPLDFMHA
jgi:hypothetical protein